MLSSRAIALGRRRAVDRGLGANLRLDVVRLSIYPDGVGCRGESCSLLSRFAVGLAVTARMDVEQRRC